MESPESSSSASTSAPAVTHHDKAEVLAAFRALSETDMGRLMGYARSRMVPVRGRLNDADAQDLFHEALVKTLDGTRRWRRGISFTQHLVGCMKSIAHNWFEQGGRNTELSNDVQASSPALDSAVDEDIQIERLRQELQADTVALSVLDNFLDGQTPAETQAMLRINEDVYWAARKRIRRRAKLLVASEALTHGR